MFYLLLIFFCLLLVFIYIYFRVGGSHDVSSGLWPINGVLGRPWRTWRPMLLGNTAGRRAGRLALALMNFLSQSFLSRTEVIVSGI